MAPDLLATSVTRAERMASEASSLELREAHLWGQSNGSISYPLEVDLSIISVENKREPFDRQDGPSGWTFRMDRQDGPSGWTFRMDRQDGPSGWTFRMDLTLG